MRKAPGLVLTRDQTATSLVQPVHLQGVNERCLGIESLLRSIQGLHIMLLVKPLVQPFHIQGVHNVV
jgi:hypothetical protein